MPRGIYNRKTAKKRKTKKTGFTKQNRKNPFSTRDDEIERLNNKVGELQARPIMEAFATKVGELIMIQLVLKPFDQWPSEAQEAFRFTERAMPQAAAMYKEMAGWK